MNVNRGLLVSCVLTLVIACQDDDVPTRDLSNQGTACLDGALVRVDFKTCVTPDCSKLVNESCTAVVKGNRLVVSSQGTAENYSSQKDGCNLSCTFATTECAVDGSLAQVEAMEYGGVESAQFMCDTQ